MKEMKFHPLTDGLPLMADGELAVVSDDMRDNGIKDNLIFILDDMIVDGRDRYRAANLADIVDRLVFIEVKDEEAAKALMVSSILRKNPTPDQKAAIAAEHCYTAEEAAAKKAGNLNNVDGSAGTIGKMSQKNSAKTYGARKELVGLALKLLEACRAGGSMDMYFKVKIGSVSIKDAMEALGVTKEDDTDKEEITVILPQDTINEIKLHQGNKHSVEKTARVLDLPVEQVRNVYAQGSKPSGAALEKLRTWKAKQGEAESKKELDSARARVRELEGAGERLTVFDVNADNVVEVATALNLYLFHSYDMKEKEHPAALHNVLRTLRGRTLTKEEKEGNRRANESALYDSAVTQMFSHSNSN